MAETKPKHRLEVALLQLGVIEETDATVLQRVEELLTGYASKADLVVLPELWRWGHLDFSHHKEQAETLAGESAVFLGRQARELSAYVIGGSIIEREGDRYFNTSLLFDRRGKIIGRYRKSHLLAYRSQERNLLSCGDETPTFATPLARLGVAICYDLRFPELFREMALAGAEVFIVPATWPITRMEAWTALCHARAVENQAYVIACGATGGGLLGHSMVVDPWGVTVASLGGEEGVLRATLDLDRLHRYREEFTAWRER
ncbi:MAG: nitrilase-related carbon-nitrogen hydrolase [Candidatus Bipolaricaulota bacterium]|nr:nitrilase-related carbon-nitrogen hydrolase [Candidatus Bipolaricaulota bacterium]